MRGHGQFDPAALQALLEPLDLRRALTAPPLDAYTRFYQLDHAAAFPGLEHRIGWVASGEFQIAVQAFMLPDSHGTALVVHGYYDHVGLFGHLLEYLFARGISVLTFDLPGHGLSSGPRATIETFDHYVRALVDVQAEAARQGADGKLLPPPDYVFGQSMGGAITMEYLLQHRGPLPKHVFLLAPLVRPAAWGINRWVYEIARRTITQRKRIITENAENAEFMALMRQDPLAPDILPVQWVTAMVAWMRAFEAREALPLDLKIIQGEADKTVDWRYNLKSIERRARTDTLRIPGARHHLVNESEVVREQIFDWVDRFLPHFGGESDTPARGRVSR